MKNFSTLLLQKFVFSFLSLLFLTSIGASWLRAQVPTISSFAPTSGAVGAVVTINGNNFAVPHTNNTVYFGGARVIPTGGTATSLTVEVPAGAVSQEPIYVENNISNRFGSSLLVSPYFFRTTQTPNAIVENIRYNATSYPTSQNTRANVVADFNNDGNMDFYATGSGQLFLGDGEGGFATPTTHTDGDRGAAADFNGDGNMDIVVGGAGGTGTETRILLGDGTGGFTVGANIGTYRNGIEVADMNNDGYIDIVGTDFTGNRVATLLNNGAASFTAYTRTIANATDVFLADFDGDGDIDVAVGSQGTGCHIGFNNGAGQVNTFPAFTFYSYGQNGTYISGADFDNDGDIDLAGSGNFDAGVFLMLNDGLGGFGTPTNLTPTGSTDARGVVAADFNGDGNADIAYTQYGGSVRVRIGNGDGTFQAPITLNTTTTATINIVPADFNNDGYTDFVVGYLNNQTSVHLHRPILFSRQNGDWNDPNTWSVDACGGVSSGAIPTQNNNVVICGHIVTLNANSTCNDLTIQTGGTLLTENFDLDIRGNTINSGTFEDNASGGTTTFRGTLTNNRALRVTGAANNSTFRFRGNITNNAAAIEFNLVESISYVFENNPVTITNLATTVGSNMVFGSFNASGTLNSNVTIANGTAREIQFITNIGLDVSSGVTLQNNYSTGTFVTGRLVGLGSFVNGTNARLRYVAVLAPAIATFDASTNAGNIVEYTALNADVLATTYRNLVIASAGTANLTGATTVQQNLTINTGATLDVTLSNHPLTFAPLAANFGLVNNGAFEARAGTVSFTGGVNQTIGGGVNTTFHNLTINQSAASTVTLSRSIVVDNDLTLALGRIVLGTNTLTHNSSADPIVTGGWVNTNGTGTFIKSVAGTDLLFPVGSNAARQSVIINNAVANASVRFRTPTPAVPNSGLGAWEINNGSTSSNIRIVNPIGGAISVGVSEIAFYDGTIWNTITPTTYPSATDYEALVPFVGAPRQIGIFSTTAYYTLGNATWDVNSNFWSTDGVTGCNCSPVGQVNATVIINSGHVVGVPLAVNIATGNSIDLYGTLTLTNGNTNAIASLTTSAGSTINILAGTLNLATATTFNGTVSNQGGTIPAAPALTFADGSTYIHARNGGAIPTATWGATSNCRITGITNLAISAGLGQTFGNFEWACFSQTVPQNNNASMIVQGNFTLTHTGTSNFNLNGNTLDLKGNWLNNHNVSSFNAAAANSTVIFSGTSPQTIGGSSATNFRNLTINNTAATPTVTITNTFSYAINQTLTLTAGRFVIGSSNILYPSTVAAITGAGWIETNGTGSFQRNPGAGFPSAQFPVGDATAKRLVTMNIGAGSNRVRFVTPISPAITGTNPTAGMWDIFVAASNVITFNNVTDAIATGRIHKEVAGAWTLLPSTVTYPTFSTSGIESSGNFTIFSPPTTYYTLGNATWNVNSNNWSNDGTNPCNCSPAGVANATVYIRNTDEVTVAGAGDIALNNTIDITGFGVLTLQNGNTNPFTLSTNTAGSTINLLAGTLNLATATTFNGTVSNQGGTIPAAPALTFADGSTYIHARNGGAIPTATWGNTSTCHVTGMTNLQPTNISGQSFGHLVWDSPSQTIGTSLFNAGVNENCTVKGNFTVLNVGTGSLTLKNGGGATVNNFLVEGNCIIEDDFTIQANPAGASTALEVWGDFTRTAGFFRFTSNNGAALGELILEGDFNNAGAFEHYTNSRLVFAGANDQTVTGNLPFTAGTGAFEVRIDKDAAANTVTLGGNITFGGTNTLNIQQGTLTTIATARTLNFTNIIGVGILDMSTGGVAHTLNLNGTGNTFNGTLISSANSLVNYNGTVAQNIFAPSSGSYGRLTLTNANVKTLLGNISLIGNFTNNAGAGNFDPDTFGVSFIGTNAQTIGGSSGTNFALLTIDNAANVGLAQSINAQSLHLEEGRLTLNTHDFGFSGTAAALTRNTGWIETNDLGSFILLNANTNFTFPIGSDTQYQPLRLSNAAANANVRFGTSTAPLTSGTASWFAQNSGATSDVVLVNPQGAGIVPNFSKIQEYTTAWNPLPTTDYPASDEYRLPAYLFDTSVKEFGIKEGSPFVTTWQTTAANESITIPHDGTGYNFTVDWGDSNIEVLTDVDFPFTHTYTTAGTYTVSITGDFPRIYFNNGGDRLKIRSIEQWGDIAWTSMENAFWGCGNLTYNATDAPDLSGVSNLAQMFRAATLFNGNLNNWDVSTIQNLNFMFWGCGNFNQPLDAWDVSSVTTMSNTFWGCNIFNQPLNSWNVSSVTNMNGLFVNNIAFNQPLDNWDVSNVTNMGNMFWGCFIFNQNITVWDISSVADLSFMFYNASSFNQNLATWNVNNVINLSNMFLNATAFNQNLGSWNLRTAGVDMNNMLDNCGMNTANYDATLIGWATNPSTPNNVTLGALGRTYCAAQTQRNTTLVGTKSWTINGDTFNCGVYYSRKDGDWTDATIGDGTWSTVALGGASCDCVPPAGANVVIDHTVTADIAIAPLQITLSGTLDLQNLNHTLATTTILNSGGTGILEISGNTAALAIASTSGDFFTTPTNIVRFNGAAAYQIALRSYPTIENNLSAGVLGLETVTPTSIDVYGDLRATNGANSGFLSNGHTIVMPDIAPATHQIIGLGTSGFSFQNLTIESNTTTGTAGAIDINGTLFVEAGAIFTNNTPFFQVATATATIDGTGNFVNNAALYYNSDVPIQMAAANLDFNTNPNDVIYQSGTASPAPTTYRQLFFRNSRNTVAGTITAQNVAFDNTTGAASLTLVDGTIITTNDLNLQNSNGATLDFGIGNATVTVNNTLNGNANSIIVHNAGVGSTQLLDLKGANNTLNAFNNTSAGTSIVRYSGNVDQNVFASPNYQNIEIQGGALKTLQGNVTASGTLTLTDGRVVLGANNLTLSNTAVNDQIQPLPITAASFVIAEGTGRLTRQNLTSLNFALFPLGVGTNLEMVQVRVGTTGSAASAGFSTPLAPLNPAGTFNPASGIWKVAADGSSEVAILPSSTLAGAKVHKLNAGFWENTGITTTFSDPPPTYTTNALDLSTEQTFTLFAKPEITLTTIPLAASNVPQGTADYPIYAFSAAVVGGNTDFQSINLTTSGSYQVSDLVNFQLWYNTTNDFATASAISTPVGIVTSGSSLNIATPQTINDGQTGYFWITTSVANAAIPTRDMLMQLPIAASFSVGDIIGFLDAGNTHTIVCAPLAFTTPSPLPNGTVGAAYTQTVAVSGLNPITTYAVQTGALPTGLVLNPTTGEISGTPTVNGISSFTLRATDGTGYFADGNYQITVGCPAVTYAASPPSETICSGATTNITLSSSPAGATFSWTVAATGTVTGQSAGAGTTIAQTLSGSGTVTYTVTPDYFGCAGTPFDVVVTVDIISPTISCPANISVNNDAGVCGAAVTYPAPTFADNCAGATVSQTAGLASGA
ncbi:BspA family leucine-rich repeat surface protein, partial [Hugenholtzia roseola]|uniref:BspA family leucine-rich repeat surface protein n=1 Tax=Hugenholtzia roseola TaxID=1002 RepID=UPI00047982C4